MSSCGQLEDLCWRNTANFHNVSQLVNFVFTRKQRISRIELSNDAPKAPHVDSHRVRDAKYDFWCPIESRLNVSVNSLADEAGATIINDLDTTLVLLLQEDVLRFQVTMDDFVILLVL